VSGGSASEPAVRPRVLRIITRLNVGGPATHVILADRGLRERGWETLLVHGIVEPDEAEVPLQDVDLPMTRLSTLARPIRPAADARALAEIARLIRSYRPHIIHTHLSKAGLLGRTAAMFVSSPAVRVHTFHGTVFGGYFGESTSGIIQRTERFLGHRTDRVVALSERQRQELLDYGIAPEDRIRIVPLGLDLDRFAGIDRAGARAALGIPADAVAVMAIGRLVPIKRIDRLVRAVAVAARSAPAIRLYLVGDGGERPALEALSGSLGLSDRVTFAGWSADTPRWYAAADMVALTSDREGTPLALIEAASAGRATVAADVGGVADIVVDGETGFVVPHDDGEALAAALTRLALDPALRQRLGAAAPARARGFAASRLVDDLDALYREAMAEHRERP
jgi:glycosyltransferase involved in cell wall biosynthesis